MSTDNTDHGLDPERAQKFFASMPDVSRVEPFDNERTCGLIVQWAEKGTGFGSFTFALDKTTGECRVDTEHMGPESVARILMRIPVDPADQRERDALVETFVPGLPFKPPALCPHGKDVDRFGPCGFCARGIE